MAAELVRMRPLKFLKPPVEHPGFTMCQARHEIHRNDPGHRWLRDAIIDATKGKTLNEGSVKTGPTQIRVNKFQNIPRAWLVEMPSKNKSILRHDPKFP